MISLTLRVNTTQNRQSDNVQMHKASLMWAAFRFHFKRMATILLPVGERRGGGCACVVRSAHTKRMRLTLRAGKLWTGQCEKLPWSL